MLMELNLAHPVITKSVLCTEVKTHGTNLKSSFVCRSRSSSAGIVTAYRLDSLLRILERARVSLRSITIQTGSGLMRLGHDIDHSVLSSAKRGMSGALPLLPLCAFMV
jgi:hypothetical protein